MADLPDAEDDAADLPRESLRLEWPARVVEVVHVFGPHPWRLATGWVAERDLGECQDTAAGHEHLRDRQAEEGVCPGQDDFLAVGEKPREDLSSGSLVRQLQPRKRR